MAAAAPAPPPVPPGAPAVTPIPQYIVPRGSPAAPPAPRVSGEEEEVVLYYQEKAPPPSGGAGAAAVVLYGLLVLAALLVLYFALVPRGHVRRRGALPLAEELAFAGWVLYGRPGCPWCARQLEVLGTNQYPKLVTCRGDRAEYTGALADGDVPLLCKNVQAFPLWVNATTGATRTGFQSVPQLENMARHPSSPGS